MKFVKKLDRDLKIKEENKVKETEKAFLVKCIRSIPAMDFDKEYKKIQGYKLFEDQVWIPKSQITDNTVSSWFAKKEDIVSV